jgi:hypothetical protein
MAHDQLRGHGRLGTIDPPPTGQTWLGAATNGLTELSSFETAAQTTATALYGHYNAWTQPFDFSMAGQVRSRAMTPMITWEPWDPGARNLQTGELLGAEQPDHALHCITEHLHDDYINQWAHDAR